MYKVGIVSEYKKGFARVFFEKENIVSDWLPINYPFTMGNKQVWPLKVQTQVHCLMDEYCEEGIIIGCSYNDEDTPPTVTDKWVTEMENGVRMEVGNTFGLKKDTDTLKQALTLIVDAVKPILVVYGNNPDFAKLAEAQTKIDNLLS